MKSGSKSVCKGDDTRSNQRVILYVSAIWSWLQRTFRITLLGRNHKRKIALLILLLFMVMYERLDSSFLSFFYKKRTAFLPFFSLIWRYFFYLHIRESTPIFLALGRLLEFNWKCSSLFPHTLLITISHMIKVPNSFLTGTLAELPYWWFLYHHLFMQQMSCFKDFVLQILKWVLHIRERILARHF